MHVGRNGTEMPRLRKILRSPRLERNALFTVGLHPEIRTLSFAVSHTRLAALPWSPRLPVGRGRRGPHQRRSGLDPRLQRRPRKGPRLEKRLPDTQHRVGLVVSSEGVAEKIGSIPL